MKQLVQGHASTTQIASKLLENFMAAPLLPSWATGQGWKIFFFPKQRIGKAQKTTHFSQSLQGGCTSVVSPRFSVPFTEHTSFSTEHENHESLWSRSFKASPQTQLTHHDNCNWETVCILRNMMVTIRQSESILLSRISYFLGTFPWDTQPTATILSIWLFTIVQKYFRAKKHFNLAKSLASASWHCSFSFSPALAKKSSPWQEENQVYILSDV